MTVRGVQNVPEKFILAIAPSHVLLWCPELPWGRCCKGRCCNQILASMHFSVSVSCDLASVVSNRHSNGSSNSTKSAIRSLVHLCTSFKCATICTPKSSIPQTGHV